jgi:CRP-like cAMP-binding protein
MSQRGLWAVGTVDLVENAFENIEQIDRWPAGEVVFREGEQPSGIYILYAGTVDMVFSARNGLRKPLRTALPGEIVGLSDAVSNTAYDCTATTRTSAKIGFVPVDVFRRKLEETPALWLDIAKHLSVDLDSCWASMRTLATAR